MALNKFMHPRNIYKTPPDFSKLAKDYKEFSEVSKVDVTGKVNIDFKDPKALRILTKCLLKSDFNLDVTIPNDRLVPTLPLRLNYILWIEDLMTTINKTSVRGLDIGTGACAIYPLLIAVKNKWHMVGTETDEGSILIAKENVCKNDLQHLIALKKNTTSSVIEYLFLEENTEKFDFCMCNPPFYTNIQELWESRSPARPAPKNGFTGSPHELITEGGELQFCRKMIEESKKYKEQILIYTSMVGHKYNLKELVIDLKAEGIKHTTTEFCQGRVTRWGLAWTYQDYDFSQIMSPKDKSLKKSTPFIFKLPELPAAKNQMDESLEKFKSILQNLQIIFKIVTKKKNEIILNIIAHSNTWSNQRRKRRLDKRLSEDKTKQPRLDLQSNISNEKSKTEISSIESNSTLNNTKGKDPVSLIYSSYNMEQTTSMQSINNEKEIVVQGITKISTKEKQTNVEMEFLNGTAGKEGLHQIIQYIKNNWK